MSALRTFFACSLLAAGCAEAPGPHAPGDPRPTYSADDIYRFEFQGIRLGMARDEACRRLVANGYSRREGDDCGPLAPREHEDEPPGDSFDGSAPGWCGQGECRAGTASETVKFINLEYERIGGRDILRSYYLWTAETGDREALTAATVAQWGEPTYFASWGYTILNYASSPEQADFYKRSTFGRCEHNPGCAEQDGVDCGAVLNDYATVTAEVTVYEGWRVISVGDRRPYLRDLHSSGTLRGRQLSSSWACMVSGIH